MHAEFETLSLKINPPRYALDLHPPKTHLALGSFLWSLSLHGTLFSFSRRVVIDNTTDAEATLVKVDSANRRGCLLEVVQLLTDLDLVISKAYISSDGGWFVDGNPSLSTTGSVCTCEGLPHRYSALCT